MNVEEWLHPCPELEKVKEHFGFRSLNSKYNGYIILSSLSNSLPYEVRKSIQESAPNYKTQKGLVDFT